MLIKIGETIYDPNDVPIVIYLTEQDKTNLSNMSVSAHYYVAFPAWMDDEVPSDLVDDFQDEISRRSNQ